ncbi:Serine/threonine-protein kinase PK-1 (fragment) [Nostocoides australiense Ben110]|uniref:Serine/threonine-protein kinase PK-1 n=1 Tax=Nostocoides australiense Ben110 TaxID=1193182 RepID=W6JWS6_9MICO
MPQLSNLTRAQAHAALETAHLDAKDVQAFSETVAKGVVISATPGEGASLRRGEDVTLTISKGKERYEVPVVAGITYKTALARLAARNLEGEVTRAYSDTVEKGRVVSSTPVAGTELKRGDKVTIVVSDGPQPIDVPTYRGMTLEEAQAAATAVGLTVVEGEQVYSTDVEQGRIVAQTPAEGQVVRGATITVQVSKGPEMVEVPSVFNLGEAKAVATLEAAGFAVKVEKFLGAPLDVCTGQTPGGGEQAPKGSTVTITIV